MSVLDKLLEDLSSTSDFVFTLMCELWGLRLHIYEKKNVGLFKSPLALKWKRKNNEVNTDDHKKVAFVLWRLYYSSVFLYY